MVDITISVPDNVANYLSTAEGVSDLEKSAMLLHPYISNGSMKESDAAKLLEISGKELHDIYIKYKMALVDITELKPIHRMSLEESKK